MEQAFRQGERLYLKNDEARLYNKCIQQQSAFAPTHIRPLITTASRGNLRTHLLILFPRTPSSAYLTSPPETSNVSHRRLRDTPFVSLYCAQRSPTHRRNDRSLARILFPISFVPHALRMQLARAPRDAETGTSCILYSCWCAPNLLCSGLTLVRYLFPNSKRTSHVRVDKVRHVGTGHAGR